MPIKLTSEQVLISGQQLAINARTGAGKTFAAMLVAARSITEGYQPLILDCAGGWDSFGRAFNGRVFSIKKDSEVVPFWGNGGPPIIINFDADQLQFTPRFKDLTDDMRRVEKTILLIIDECHEIQKYAAHLQLLVPFLVDRGSTVLILTQDPAAAKAFECFFQTLRIESPSGVL